MFEKLKTKMSKQIKNKKMYASGIVLFLFGIIFLMICVWGCGVETPTITIIFFLLTLVFSFTGLILSIKGCYTNEEMKQKEEMELIIAEDIKRKAIEENIKNDIFSKLDGYFNTRIKNVSMLMSSKKCNELVEKFYHSSFNNKFRDLHLYILPKTKDHTYNGYDQLRKNKNNIIVLYEKYIAKYLIDKSKSMTDSEDELIMQYYTMVIDANTVYLDSKCFYNGLEEYDLNNRGNGIEAINLLYSGLLSMGVINDVPIEDFYAFVCLKIKKLNNEYYETLNVLYDIDTNEFENKIRLLIDKILKANDDATIEDFGYYLITHPDNCIYVLISTILEKYNDIDLAVVLTLLFSHTVSFEYDYCMALSKQVLDAYMKSKKAMISVNMLIDGHECNMSINRVDGMNGSEFESFVADLFIKLGYITEITKTSGDQGVDIIATKGGKRLAIQTKCYSGAVGNHAIMEVVGGMKFYDCNACMVVTNSTFTQAAKELANKNNVELWDRNDLEEQIELLY